MAKQVIYGEEARNKLKAGVEAIANAVITTLGPKGRNVSIERQWTHPHVVHDGVTVAREIELADPFENQGAQMVKEASSKTNDVAGDGTTTSMVIANAVVQEGLKNVTAGANPMVLKQGIEDASVFVNKRLKKISVKIEEKQQMEHIAHISAASQEIGQIVADALEKVGRNGTITAEEWHGLGCEIEYKEGMEIKSGFISPHFITNPERMEAEVEDCHILITDRELSSPNEMLRFLQGMLDGHKLSNIVVIARNVEGPALAMLVANKMRGIIKSIAIKAPHHGDRQRDVLEDIAALTGGRVVSEDRGVELNSVEREDLGFAKKIIATRDSTIIVADRNEAIDERIGMLQRAINDAKSPQEAERLGDRLAKVDERIGMLQRAINDAKSPQEAERLGDRLAKLEGGVAVINVGASTDVEMKEKVERVKDAIGATKAALDEGIIPGGGVGLLIAANMLYAHMEEVYKNKPRGDHYKGMEIVVHALTQPLWHIANNAGQKADHVVESVRERNLALIDGTSKESTMLGDWIGYNVYTDQYVKMIEAGVIDPVKVSRHAVIHGCSVGMMVLTTECLISDIPEDNKNDE